METTIDRFFKAFDIIAPMADVSLREFCRELGTRHTSFIKQRDDHTRNIIRPHWLEHVVEKYGISPRWLLTGKGEMFCK